MSDWTCDVPSFWGRWLASEHGPLAGQATTEVTYDGGSAVTLTQAAFDALAHLGTLAEPRDGRILYEGDVPCLAFDPERYEVIEVQG